MTQQEFLKDLKRNKRWQRSLLGSAIKATGDNGSEYNLITDDADFYMSLGMLFDEMGINGWESESFIDKVCKTINAEW
ncbi:MAG: hypothetical protein FWG84_06610 [Bacteroidales bacterium]|nr:hypothetical protein [Bacteroidales bacterium]